MNFRQTEISNKTYQFQPHDQTGIETLESKFSINQEDRIFTLEKQVASFKSQIQKLTYTNSSLKNQINAVHNKVESMATNIEEKFETIQNSHSDTISEMQSLAKNMNEIAESIDTLIQTSKSNNVSTPSKIPNQNLAPNSLIKKLSFTPTSHHLQIPHQSSPTNSLIPIVQKNEPSRSRSYIPKSPSHNPPTFFFYWDRFDLHDIYGE